jgi:hypothetical protein
MAITYSKNSRPKKRQMTSSAALNKLVQKYPGSNYCVNSNLWYYRDYDRFKNSYQLNLFDENSNLLQVISEVSFEDAFEKLDEKVAERDAALKISTQPNTND